MYQQQAFHTANYRGNQQGHDQYLRADSQQPSTFASTPVTSQYRGFQKTFQPTGQVQSFYNPERNPQAGFNTNTFSNQITSGQFTSAVNPQSYHTANYRGDQPGHDQYLRADSVQPNNMGTMGAAQSYAQSGYSSAGHTGYPTTSSVGSAFNQTGQGFAQSTTAQGFQSPQSFHTASYRGDQPGHDQYLRADSVQPNNVGTMGASQSYGQAGYNTTTSNFGQSSYNPASSSVGQTGFRTSTGTSSAFNQAGQGFTQSTAAQGFQSPQSFHTASYRGDQPGHDQYLRADSVQPNNAGAFGANRAFNSTSFI